MATGIDISSPFIKYFTGFIASISNHSTITKPILDLFRLRSKQEFLNLLTIAAYQLAAFRC